MDIIKPYTTRKVDKSISFYSLIEDKMKVLVATEKPFAKDAIAGIQEIVVTAGFELVLLESYSDKSELLAAVSDVDALIIRSDKVTAEVLEAGEKLKIVVRAGAGYDNVDTAVAIERGVVVMNTPGQNSNAVAELAISMMIFMARNQFTPGTGGEIKDKCLGIHAYGNIGKIVAKYGKAFGMTVCAYDPFITDLSIFENDGIEVVASVEELYAKSDFLSLHIPSTPQTVNSVDYDLFMRMPKGATVVNTARKEVIDEAGLAKALAERTDLKYITDVAATTQSELNSAFGTRVFATTKKIGAESAEANINAGLAAATQIVNFFRHGDTTFQVNKINK